MRNVVLVDAARSAFCRLGGGLRDLTATDLGAFVARGLAERTELLARGGVDGLMAGSAFGDCQALSPARYVVLSAGLPTATFGAYVEMQCGSAIAAINHAAVYIAAGLSDVILAGGMESYSTQAAKFSMSTPPYRLIPPTALPPRFAPDEEQNTDMISNNERMARQWGITREACDAFALESQQRLASAYATGLTGPEIIPYTIPATRKTPAITVDRDEHPRPDTTAEALSGLRPAREGGVTTAGNASGMNDGAAFVLLMAEETARARGYTPFARWVTGAAVGCAPNLMGIGASYASLEAMRKAGLRIGEIDVFECNEAFAAQNLCVIEDMQAQTGEQIDLARWNPNGGAIAIGHPNAASGARITHFAAKQLERAGGRYAVVSACCGSGQGVASIWENLRLR